MGKPAKRAKLHPAGGVWGDPIPAASPRGVVVVALVLAGCGDIGDMAGLVEPVECEGGLVACDGSCIDPMIDSAHCGATDGCEAADDCGARGENCIAGACEAIDLGSPRNPGRSCLDILDAGAARSSGEYFIDADGSGRAVRVYCDMTTDGGGWTYWLYDGLAAHWSFDGVDPTVDDVGGLSGVLEGGAATSSTALAPDFGASLEFLDPEDSRLTLSSTLAIGAESSFVFWTHHTTCINNQIPLHFADNSFIGDLYRAAGSVNLTQAGTVMSSDEPSNCEQTAGRWIHHVYIDDRTSVRYYRDAIEVPPDSYTYHNLAGIALSRFGSRPGFGTNGLGGRLDDVAVFHRALSPAEIQMLHRAALAGLPLRWR